MSTVESLGPGFMSGSSAGVGAGAGAKAAAISPSWIVFLLTAAIAYVLFEQLRWLYQYAKVLVLDLLDRWRRVSSKPPARRNRSRSRSRSPSPRPRGRSPRSRSRY